MTTSRRGGHSRPGSSRATSVAREIMKRRDKPYRTEKQRVLMKKRKLELNTSYRQAPEGYTFVAVGTPELSARCKELSRQRGFAVSVVNAKPASKHAVDPAKVSHHIHRIGYHFKTEVVEQAREELGYVYYRDHFVKEADLQAQYQQSHTARIMAQHGIHMTQPAVQETPSQVRGAIKELFPKIPDDDLDQIVEHAWKEGSHRVGTNAMLELPRRVQLATIARIRHTYTDYDRLLRAFEWKEARSIVEQECLKKLIEWRGENDIEDDNELEEIVRETIVIDDDDEENSPGYDSEADDEDSDPNVGDTSDASIEFTHHIAIDDDLGAESVDETSRNFLQRFQPRSLRTDQQNSIAKEKLGAARQQLRHGLPPQALTTCVDLFHVLNDSLTGNSSAMPMAVRSDQSGLPPDAIVVDGTVYRLAPAESDQLPSSHRPIQVHQPPQQQGIHGAGYESYLPSNRFQPYPGPSHSSPARYPTDRVLPSIEPHGFLPTRDVGAAVQMAELRTPERQHPDKRPRIEYSPDRLHPLKDIQSRPVPQQRLRATHRGHEGSAGRGVRDLPSREDANLSNRGEIIDLTSPERRNVSGYPSPMRDVRYRPAGQVSQDQYTEQPPVAQKIDSRPAANERRETAVEPEPYEPYDPTQPLLPLPQRYPVPDVQGMAPRYGQDTSFQTPQALPSTVGLKLYNGAAHLPQETYAPYSYRQVVYPAPQSRLPQGHSAAPQPVHGAPAPVQQVPPSPSARSNTQPYRTPVYLQQAQPPLAPRPVNGAPHPAQYYYYPR